MSLGLGGLGLGGCADSEPTADGRGSGGDPASAGGNGSAVGGEVLSGSGGQSPGGSATGGSSSGAGGSAPSGGSASAGGSGGPAGGSAGTSSGGSATGGAGATGGSAASGGGSSVGGSPAVTPDWPQINGVQWADTDGNPIQAHGGGVLKVEEYYYWFGENRNPDGTFFAVSAYRSRDLKQWEFRNHVLHMTSDPGLDPANVERPKVIYNESTGKFVMWMHWENGMDYGEARAAVASSDVVDGDYTYHGSFRPFVDSGVMDHGKPGYMSRDCTLFVDDDGTGYFLSTTNENYDLNLYRLTPDYLEPEELAATLFEGGHREAPALFKRDGIYFLISSGSTGWDPNQGSYATSSSLTSGWSSLKNFGDGTTFYSQSTYVVEVSGGAESQFLYMGDRWAGAYGGRVNDSTYLWQPLSFGSDTQVSMVWNNVLDLNAQAGKVSGSIENFVVKNKNSGLLLDVAEGSSANNADIVQMPASGNASQSWRLDYNKRGYFRLINEGSGLLIDVPDESTQDGVELIQYNDHDGDNQSWRVIDLGGGEYRLRNQNSQKYMGVVAGSTMAGSAVEQRTETGGEEQVWIISVAE